MSVPAGGDPGVVQATFCATVVDEWVRAGVRHAVVCPGSRSAPLALAVAARPELVLHTRLDERSAGFFALGLGLATGLPAVMVTTSGTAAAEVHAAVLEAHHGRVPLVVCTADRPPELQQVGAPQTTEQAGLFGAAVRWAWMPGPPDEHGRSSWRPSAARSVLEAVGGPAGPGPVHLNLALREPLVASPGPLDGGRAGGAPWTALAGVGPAGGDPAGFAAEAPARGMVVAGARCGPAGAVLAAAEALGWPVLADPRSGCRVPGTVAAADPLVKVPEVAARLRPDAVLLLGERWASKGVAAFVRDAADGGATVTAVDPWWTWADPDRVVARVERTLPDPWLAAVAATAPGHDTTWRDEWAAAEAAAQRALAATLEPPDGALTEPGLARILPGLVAGQRLVVSSSMPVRDLEAFAPVLEDPPQVLSNRGLNGIDGVVATTLGVAAAGGSPVTALLGDLAFLHDLSGLVRLAGQPPAAPCTLVVVDNGGGGIFSFLPVATATDGATFERLFATPAETDLRAVAAGLGLAVTEVATHDDLRRAFAAEPPAGVVRLVVARVPGRPANLALHRQVDEAVSGAVQG